MKEKLFLLKSGEVHISEFEFFDNDCFYPLKYFKEQAKKTGKNIIVEGGVIVYGDDFFYCPKIGEVGLTSESECGKVCEFYKPRNGKNGRCVHHKNCYEPNGSHYSIEPDGLVYPIEISRSEHVPQN